MDRWCVCSVGGSEHSEAFWAIGRKATGRAVRVTRRMKDAGVRSFLGKTVEDAEYVLALGNTLLIETVKMSISVS